MGHHVADEDLARLAIDLSGEPILVAANVENSESAGPPNGTPVNSSTGIVHPRNYAQLSFQEAAGNAYTYAQFALHAFMGRDKRIVPFDE
jgi:hypothetical protein